jgi:hypothetical protein
MTFLIADTAEKLTFVFAVVVGVIIPVTGLMISISELQKPGGASRCTMALIVFFGLGLLGGFTALMQLNEAIYEALAMVLFLMCAMGHCLAAILAIVGIAASRKRRQKWHATRRREGWSFWLNTVAILSYGIYFLSQAFPKLFEVKPS